MGINDSIAGIGTPITKPTLKNLLALCAKCQQRMIRSCTAFVGIISDRHSLLLAVGRFHSGVYVNHKTGQHPNVAFSASKRLAPDAASNPMIQALHLIDVFLCESTQYATECAFIRNPQPTGRTTQNTVVPNRHNRTNRTGATNNADHRQNDHVHRVIKTRGTTLMVYGLLCL